MNSTQYSDNSVVSNGKVIIEYTWRPPKPTYLKIDMSQTPMYALIPSLLPSIVRPVPRKTKRRTMGNPIVKNVRRPLALIPTAQAIYIMSQTRKEYPTFFATTRVGIPSSGSVPAPKSR